MPMARAPGRHRAVPVQLPCFPGLDVSSYKEWKSSMIVTTKQLFQHAYGKYAVGAYNINNLEQTVGLFRGNLGKSKSNNDPVNPATSAPFIIQISRGARSYTDKRFLEAMIRTADAGLSRGRSSPSISTTAPKRSATTASRAASTAR